MLKYQPMWSFFLKIEISYSYHLLGFTTSEKHAEVIYNIIFFSSKGEDMMTDGELQNLTSRTQELEHSSTNGGRFGWCLWIGIGDCRRH